MFRGFGQNFLFLQRQMTYITVIPLFKLIILQHLGICLYHYPTDAQQ